MKKLICFLVVGLLVISSGICLAEDEFGLLPPEIVYPAEIVYPGISGQVTLREGWNLIAMPVLPQNPLTVEGFIKMAYSDGRQPGGSPPYIQATWRVLVVAVYKNGRFETYPRKGVTYNMVPGEAYFVYAQYEGLRPLYDIDPAYAEFHPSTTITITGKPVDVSVSLNLNRGWNGAALMRKQKLLDYEHRITELPRIPDLTLNKADLDSGVLTETAGYRIIGSSKFGSSLSQLSRELTEQGVKANRIVFWNAYKQEWEQYELPYVTDPPTVEPFSGIRFERLINGSEGFFLLCEENGLYVPGLTSRPEMPPIPPMPPERVKYAGKVEGIMYACFGPPPPYTHELDLDDGTRIHLKGADDAIEGRLEIARQDGGSYIVEGVMTTMLNYNGQPDGAEGYPVDVLVVKSVSPADGRFYPIDLIVEAEKDLCARLEIPDEYIEGIGFRLISSIHTCDYPSSHIVNVYAIGLVYGGNTHIYEGVITSGYRRETTISVEYKGSRITVYDNNGKLILEL